MINETNVKATMRMWNSELLKGIWYCMIFLKHFESFLKYVQIYYGPDHLGTHIIDLKWTLLLKSKRS